MLITKTSSNLGFDALAMPARLLYKETMGDGFDDADNTVGGPVVEGMETVEARLAKLMPMGRESTGHDEMVAAGVAARRARMAEVSQHWIDMPA